MSARLVGQYLRREFGISYRDIAAHARQPLLESVEHVPCNLCRADNPEPVASSDKYGLPVRTVICRRCGLLYLNPRPTTAAYQRFYDEGGRRGSAYHQQVDFATIETMLSTYTGTRFRMTRKERQRMRLFQVDHGLNPRRRLLPRRPPARPLLPHAVNLYQQTRRYIPEGGSIFEVGAHHGVILHPWQANGYHVTGVEPTREAVRQARKLRGIHLIHGYSDHPNIPENTYDLVINARTINHMLDPLGDLKHAWRWLKPGGILLVDIADAIEKARRKGFERNTVEVDHPYIFSVRTLAAMVQAAGFELVERHAEDARILIIARKSDTAEIHWSTYAEERAELDTIPVTLPRRPVDAARSVVRSPA